MGKPKNVLISPTALQNLNKRIETKSFVELVLVGIIKHFYHNLEVIKLRQKVVIYLEAYQMPKAK